MLASYPELASQFPGVDVDAAVSRGLRAGVGIASTMAAEGRLRPVVVVGLGTNGPIDVADLEELRSICGSRLIVLVNAHADRWWIPEVNSTLEAFAAATPGVTLARWDEGIALEPQSLADDGIHPGARGGLIYATALRTALAELGTPGEAIGWALPRR